MTMKNGIRILSILTVLVLLLALPMLAMATEQQAENYATSGDLSREKPTKEQIIEAWHQVSVYDSYYAQEPSVVYPYATGALTDDLLESGLSYLNYIRYVAGLPSVQLSDSLNENAQYGAVVLAAIDQLTHYPSKPSDMSDDFYIQGYNATTSSNISMRWGYGNINYLQSSLQGCLADDGSNNLATVGHRRWLLNPRLLDVGFGFAESTTGAAYVTTKVFDSSGAAVNFEFISWPASGYVPSNLFDADDPWSISLNTSLYQKPQAENITVTLTRESDGQQWTFDANTGGPTTSQYPYMTVNNQGYGISNCLIFSPGSDAIGTYDGVYTVKIEGLFTASGEPTELSYQVEFFDIGPCQHVYTEKKVEATCVSYGYTIRTCKICGESSYGDYVWDGPHSWGEGVVTEEPTDLKEGTMTYTCKLCSHTKTESIPALGGHVHIYGAFHKEPTCSTSGYTEYRCTCGHSYRDNYVDPLPHTVGTPVETEREEPSCLMDGHVILSWFCTECGTKTDEKYQPIPAPGHIYEESVIEATCTDFGFVYHTCTVCGSVETIEVRDPLGHARGPIQQTVIQERSCAAQGIVINKAFCKRCGFQLLDEYVTTEPYPHTPGELVEVGYTAPYCETEGERVYSVSCEACHTYLGIQSEKIPALGHDMTEWAVSSEPTAEESGWKERHCLRCWSVNWEEIDNNPFPDVQGGNQFKDYVLWCYYNEIVGGKKDGTFDGNGVVTRGQFILMLWRAAGKPEPTQYVAFPDVTENNKTYYKAVCWAVEKGITNGKKDGSFGLNDECTRGHVALFLYRFAGSPKIEGGYSFSDVTGGTYYNAVCWLAENEIASGQKDGTFGVANACKRYHTAKFLYLFMNLENDME